MADHSRLEALRRRVEKDPASIAFAQLAEEYRRAGEIEHAVQVCRAGLGIHPGYLSARVTLGRALIELNQLDDAQAELDHVLHNAPENLAAIRGLAEIHHRRGELSEALDQYRAAFAIARNDPDLERTVEELSRKVEPQPRVEPDNALSLEHLHEELLAQASAPKHTAPVALQIESAPAAETAASTPKRPDLAAAMNSADAGSYEDVSTRTSAVAVAPLAPVVLVGSVAPGASDKPVEVVAPIVSVAPLVPPVASVATVTAPASEYNVAADATRDRAHRTIAALERWLDALNGSRTHTHA